MTEIIVVEKGEHEHEKKYLYSEKNNIEIVFAAFCS
jgi:hypothetical protein